MTRLGPDISLRPHRPDRAGEQLSVGGRVSEVAKRVGSAILDHLPGIGKHRKEERIRQEKIRQRDLLVEGMVGRLATELPRDGYLTHTRGLRDDTEFIRYSAIYTTRQGEALRASLGSYRNPDGSYHSLDATVSSMINFWEPIRGPIPSKDGITPGEDGPFIINIFRREISLTTRTIDDNVERELDSTGNHLGYPFLGVSFWSKLSIDQQIELLSDFATAEFNEAETGKCFEDRQASEMHYGPQGDRATETTLAWPRGDLPPEAIELPGSPMTGPQA